MPWSTSDDLSKYNSKLDTAAKKRQWVQVANSARNACIKKGGDPADCDARAIRTANGVLKKKEVRMQSSNRGIRPHEAATIKSRVQGLIRDINSVLEDKDLPSAMKKELEAMRAKFKSTWDELAAEATGDKKEAETAEILYSTGKTWLSEISKKIGGVNHPLADFLVAEDPEDPATWHLPVITKGKPDRKLAAGAWAALFSKGGFRGNKYEGPGKAAAKAKLRQLYKDEGWDEPQSEVMIQKEAAECGPYSEPVLPPMPQSVMSFSDLDVALQTNELMEHVKMRINQYNELLWRVLWNTQDPAQLYENVEGLTVEFLQVIREALDAGAEGDEYGEIDALAEVDQVSLKESYPLSMYDSELKPTEILAEAAAGADPMTVDMVIIRPGWGNPKDKNFYPIDVLQRDAHVFEGAKQYETDHRQEEKSTRTWVSTITKIVGFTDDGAPIGRAVVHDPSFAERLRNLKAADLLDKMECSILAQGTARRGKVDGQVGNIVESILAADSVDWVTRAGAGGQATNISEGDSAAAPTEVTMTDPKESKVPPGTAQPLAESEDGTASAPIPVVVPAQPPQPPVTDTPPPTEEPKLVSAAEVAKVLQASRLPAASIARLKEVTYANDQALASAVTSEVEYVKALTGSGTDPAGGTGIVSLGEKQADKVTLAEVEAKKDAVLKQYGFIRH